MREVLFRGRDEDGVWREGYYCVNPHNPKQNFMTLDWALCQVVPKAIGQYIGIEDSEGVRIFEGDIASFSNDLGEPCVGVVKYCTRTASYRIFTNDHESYILGSDYNDDLKKLGNIHDNPELLK